MRKNEVTSGSQAGGRRALLVRWGPGIVLALVHGILAWLHRAPLLLTAQDDALYMLLAQSLLQGEYINLYEAALSPHLLYPPGFPLMLAGWGSLFGHGFHSYVALSVLLSSGAVLLAYHLLSRHAGRTVALVSGVLIALNPFLLERAGTVRSEPSLMFLTLLALAIWGDGRSDRRIALAGTVAAVATMSRLVGLALVVAIVVQAAWRRRWLASAVVVAVTVVLLGPWAYRNYTAGTSAAGSQSYVAQATLRPSEAPVPVPTWVARFVKRRVETYATAVPWMLPAPAIRNTPVDNAAGLAVAVVGLVAGLVLFLRTWPQAFLYLAATGSVLSVWVYGSPRFLEPLLPLLIGAIIAGVGVVAGRAGPRWRTGAILAVAALILVGCVQRFSSELLPRGACRPIDPAAPPECLAPDRASFLVAADHIDRTISDDAVFVSGKPEPLYSFTGNRSVVIGRGLVGESPVPFSERLRELDVDYVLIGALRAVDTQRLSARLLEDCGSFRVAGHFPPRTYLLAVADSELPAEENACDALTAYREATRNVNFAEQPYRLVP